MCSSTMRLSTFCGLHRGTEQLLRWKFLYINNLISINTSLDGWKSIRCIVTVLRPKNVNVVVILYFIILTANVCPISRMMTYVCVPVIYCTFSEIQQYILILGSLQYLKSLSLENLLFAIVKNNITIRSLNYYHPKKSCCNTIMLLLFHEI